LIEAPDLVLGYPLATDGDIAVINLESARQQSWSRFWPDPQRPGIAEHLVEQEQLAAQYVGDLKALDRLETLVNQLDRIGADSMRTALIRARVASTSHRFAEARDYVARAEARGANPADVDRLRLSIDQACGTSLEVVLRVRQQMATDSGRLEDLVPLGALLADLHDFDGADRIYDRALREYTDVSPFAAAWVCFQRGLLWGELVPDTQSSRAAPWYRKAIEYLPCYVKARVHLSEIYLHSDNVADAEVLLVSVVSSGDPEVSWRLAEVMAATGRLAEAEAQMKTARLGFEILLRKHLLAFADHGAEFYSRGAKDEQRAFQLASINVANRPTLRAFEQVYETAVAAGETLRAAEILSGAAGRWAGTSAFKLSPLAAKMNDVRLKSSGEPM
jgi:tetratricopeptide (TPR) repeat protein